MLKFSGYPYLIRGQPYERFNGRGRPALPSDMCHNARRQTAQPETLRRAAMEIAAAPNTKRGLSGEMTLEQACPAEYHGAQCAFKDSMIH